MTDQAELDQLAIAELQQLQRQHRLLQLELRTLLEDKTKQLRKQHHIISMLQREQQSLADEISTIEFGTHARLNAHKEKRLASLQKRSAKMQQELQEKRVNLWELEGHIKKIEKEIDALRKNEVPDSNYKDTLSRVKKTVVQLENRLDVVNKRSSDVLAENCKLRDSINHMLKERASFNEIWQSAVGRYNDGKKYIMDLIDQSTLAFDQREELCNKLQVLKDRNENDKLMHVQEMREMQRRLEHDAKLHQFFDIKGQKRLNPELEQREMDKRLAQKDVYERQLAEYREIIEEIKQLYDEPDTSFLAKQFKRQEDENFALFSYVNELSHEVETLHDTTQDLNDEIERQQSDLAEKEEKQKTESLAYLNSQLKDAEQRAQEAKDHQTTTNTHLQDLLHGIDEVFKKLACADAPIINVLSLKTGLTEHNVKLIVGVIERCINLMINKLNVDELPSKILAKKNRIPKFNIRQPEK